MAKDSYLEISSHFGIYILEQSIALHGDKFLKKCSSSVTHGLGSNTDTGAQFTIQHLPSVMVLQSVPHPQLAILVSSLMPISPFPIRFLHLLARASTTSGIADAYALSLTSVQPTSLAHHSYIQSSITATHCTMVFQKPS